MKKLLFILLLLASPALQGSAWAEVKPAPKKLTSRVDPCAPIGQTADRRLVYSLDCGNLGPPPPPPQAEIAPPPPP